MNWIGIIVENSMELIQIAGVYMWSKKEIQHIADRMFEQGLLIDYEVMWFDDIDNLNEYLRNIILLSSNDD